MVRSRPSEVISMDSKIRGTSPTTDIAEGKVWFICDLFSIVPSHTVIAAVINPIMP